MGERRYGFYSFLMSALDGVSCSVSVELVWTQTLDKKLFAFAGDRNLVVQSVVIHYTD
jgi:hypothetical protein